MQRGLQTVCERLAGLASPWAVTGSVGLVLAGFELQPRDLDLETDAEGALEIGARFGAEIVQPVAPVSSDRVRSHYGRFALAGIAVEIMGAMSIRDATGIWHPPLDFESDVQVIDWQRRKVPIVRVAAQLRMYERLGRAERVALLRRHLAAGE
jgi:hypothetical protein